MIASAVVSLVSKNVPIGGGTCRAMVKRSSSLITPGPLGISPTSPKADAPYLMAIFSKMAIKYGASALGLVGEMPSGPGVISDELLFTIARQVPPPIGTFLLTSETTADAIIAHHQKVLTNTIQIVDALREG